ncbi:threonine-phosphate decarboxylase CobD [Acetivibrio cellulolyticus]|uniref:threonine-phosphate decarboxylase CobD n=1 Tax=Acetivibrio cellulolyticus TaxID=35830 RepID=UPI0001E2F58D|nr:threonine-phosphate decarboxylase CobD [Acetivibrio cellulolyticus]
MSIDIHGGNIYETARQYGFDQRELIDFSANINPLGISRYLKELLTAGIEDLVNYPDMECNELRNELSRYLGVPKDLIITGNGAAEIIRLLFEVLKPEKLFMPAPCFAEYERAAESSDTLIIYHELREEDEFRLDIDRFIRDIPHNVDTILMCNPNNPTSKLIPKSDLKKLIEYACNRNINVIIDEAFIELTVGGNDNSVVGWLEQYNNLFVIRSLTKILAVPGLRIGYALGDCSIIQKMLQCKIPWSVNSLACSMGRALNEDRAYFEATSEWLLSEKEWFYSKLANINSFKVFKPDTNFILIKILDERLSAATLRKLLIKKGIMIRDASNFRFLNEKFIRLAIKDREANCKILSALSEILC